MQQLISWSRRRFAQVRSQRAEKGRPETRFACDRDRFADTQVVQERRAGLIDRLLNAANKHDEKTKAEGTSVKEVAPAK